MTAIQEVLVEGQIQWCGVPVACGTCGASTGLRWRLVEDPVYLSGDLAYLSCAEGHRTDHALVYPQAVRALLDALDTGELDAALAAIRWRPHDLRVRDVDVSTESAVVQIYVPWEKYVRGVRRDRWPELLAAAEATGANA